jgi:glycosyltransferase involved in cell wall biosynthesis
MALNRRDNPVAQAFASPKQGIYEIDYLAQGTLTDFQGHMGESRKMVSAIVPVFDEETTVKKVVEVLLASHLINEVICVNDGSSDGSLAVLETFGKQITLIDLKQNQGKGYALVAGICAAQYDIVAFFDADLANLSDRHIETLLAPILDASACAVLGYPTGDALSPTVFSDLTGERAYYRCDLLPYLTEMETKRFGIEVFLNETFRDRAPLKVPLTNLRGLYKYEKHPPAKALREYIGEAIEVAQEIGRREGLMPEDRQIMARLKDVTDFDTLKKRIARVRNASLRQYLEEYVLKYFDR